jgi:phosphoribosylglycinamide formyltransferase, formyltetrahydrofolate-dependent
MEYLNIGFFSSHGGTNMQAIIDACKKGRLNGKPSVIISNNADSMALSRAKSEGIPNFYRSKKTHPDSEELDDEILKILKKHSVNIIVLVGYMKKIGPKVLEEYRGRILNIHPALLPKYGGKGMYGAKVHEAVIANKENITGVTVHIIDEEYDNGPIINQCEIPVYYDDTVDKLANRVLEKEHVIFVETLQKISEGKIRL